MASYNSSTNEKTNVAYLFSCPVGGLLLLLQCRIVFLLSSGKKQLLLHLLIIITTTTLTDERDLRKKGRETQSLTMFNDISTLYLSSSNHV